MKTQNNTIASMIANKMNMDFDQFMKLYDTDLVFKSQVDKILIKISEDMKVKSPELYNNLFA
jgi:hypothetical protein